MRGVGRTIRANYIDFFAIVRLRNLSADMNVIIMCVDGWALRVGGRGRTTERRYINLMST